jgi:hypothetical protein
MRYQHTPEASKGNAFCWESWTPRIVWRTAAQEDAGAKHSQAIEDQRARGIEPAFVPHVAARTNPLHPSRFQARRKRRA